MFFAINQYKQIFAEKLCLYYNFVVYRKGNYMNETIIGVMPAYNEEENIETTAIDWYLSLIKYDKNAKLLVVNDGSKDNTLNILYKINKVYPNIIPIAKENGGHGSAVLKGYEEAIKYNPTWVFQTDSDGQTNPDEFEILWNNRNKKEILIGQRTKRKDGFSRFVVTRILRFILYVIYGVWIKDANSPFRLMKTTTLKNTLKLIPYNNLPNIYLSIAFYKLGDEIYYFPISFIERQGGVNSINIKKITKIGLKAIKEFFVYKKEIKKLV